MSGKTTCAIFSYIKNDFRIKFDSKTCPEFDILLKNNWQKIEQQNVLRYSLEQHQWRSIQGRYSFTLQLNALRGVQRRAPENISSMNQPFDKSRFNFTKIKNNEILFKLNNNPNDLVIVNVSPITWGHSLLITELDKLLPQKATIYSIEKAIHLMLLSNSIDFRVVFNSLCANASVNHLHWHLYHLEHRMLLETIELEELIGPVYTIQNYPAKGFCLRLQTVEEEDIKIFITNIYTVLNCFQQNEIAHNVYVTRAKITSSGQEFDEIRAYIWARISSYRATNLEECKAPFNIAACELFGHLLVKDQKTFSTLTEEYVINCLEEATRHCFSQASEKIKEIMGNNSK